MQSKRRKVALMHDLYTASRQILTEFISSSP